ncbi:MAG: apolipoprotein N-acyltransferase [Alphaproteobacteria bacterium]
MMSKTNAASSVAPAPLWGLFFVSALCGAASAFAMAPHHYWGLLLLGLGGLFIIQHALQKNWQAFLSGWLFGFLYFTLGLYWIGNALLVEGNDYAWAWPLAVSGLPAMLAFFPALACYISKKLFGPKGSLPYFTGFGAVLTLSELLRGYVFTGFPWNLYGYSWGGNLEMLQILHIGNVYWLTALTIFWGAGLGFLWIKRAQKIHALTGFMLILGSMVLVYSYGAMRLNSINPDTQTQQEISVRLVQPNIDQAEKWERGKMSAHYEALLDLSAPDTQTEANVPTTLIVWPETATNYLFLQNEYTRMQMRDMLSLYNQDVYLITGALMRNEDGAPTNSLLVLDKNAEIIHRYDKSHLVPFGEYIPFQNWIPLDTVSGFSGFKRGQGPDVINLDENLSFSPLICYEILFPSRIIPSDEKPGAVINVTNDAWYGLSAGPYQHYLKARFRAIEENLPVIRVANTGFSGIFDGYGQEISKIDLFETRAVVAHLPLPTTPPNSLQFYINHILWITMLLIVLILAAKKYNISKS